MDGKEAGWKHFAAADWAAARDAFAAVLEDEPDDPEALDGLGQSLWWLGERDAGIERRREAYAAYRRRGEDRARGRLAAYLAGEHRIDGQDAAAAGWLARARRLLADAGTVPELGWLAIEDAKRAADPVEAERHCRDALAVAEATGDADVECMALAQLGRAAGAAGARRGGRGAARRGDDGRARRRDERPARVRRRVLHDARRLRRARRPQPRRPVVRAVVEFNERRRFMPLQSWCRGIYGAVLVRAGAWERAEAVLAEALARMADRRRGGGRALPLAVLADLRLRQGRGEEAERLLEGLEDEPAALVPLVRLALRRGELALARALLDRRDEDGDVLVLRGELALAAGDLAAAAAAAERLREVAEAAAREDLLAEAALLAGRAAGRRAGRAADGAARRPPRPPRPGSRRRSPASARSSSRSRRPARGSRSPASRPRRARRSRVPTARAARDAFERLGARRDADQAAALLRELGASGRSAARGERDELTAARARGARPARRRPLERRDRGAAGHRAEDRRAPRRPRAREARRAQPRRGGRARRARWGSADPVAVEDAVGVVAALDRDAAAPRPRRRRRRGPAGRRRAR